jgi:predicted RNA-binding protein with PUA-like domain
MPWLLKTEPSEYAWPDLAKVKKATWNGVTNALALKHMRAMKKGDLCLIYHTGDEKAVVGIAKVAKEAYPDPAADNEKLVVVDLKPIKALKSPITLEQIKSDKAFAGWDLLRIGRLSVVPTPQEMFDRVLELAAK